MKFMNLKRFASTVMAGVLTLSLAVPAFASTTNITGTYTPITLAVTVPTTGKAIINPYGLPYNLDTETTVSGQQITTGAALLVQNKSVVALSVDVSVTGTEVGNFEFDSSAVSDSEQGNKGNVIFQMFEAPGISDANVTDTDVLNQKFAALKDADALCDVVVDPDKAATDTDIVTLKAGTSDGELQDGGAAFFRLSGTVAKKPTVEWAKTDGFTVAVVFTFTPSTFVENAGTIAADAGQDSDLTALNTTCDFTLTPASGVNVTTWSWESSDTSVATVAAKNDTKSATVTRVAAGDVTITVTGTDSNGVVYSASVDLTVA